MDSRPMYDVHIPPAAEGRRYITKLVKNYRSHQVRKGRRRGGDGMGWALDGSG
jgi:hypothetical protein